MDYKKLFIEGAVYPAMTLLQHNQVAARMRELLAAETLPPEVRVQSLRQRLSELLYLCKTQVPAYADLSFTDLDIRREPLDCLQAVDPMTLSDFFAERHNHLSRLQDRDRLLCCPFGEDQSPFYLTQAQLEQYEAARWRGLSWYGVTFGSASVRLWDRPRPEYLLKEEPYLKNRLSLSVCAMTERSVPPTVEEIDRFKPEYLSGSASSLLTLAGHMERAGISFSNQLKVATVTQGVATEDQRRNMEQIFRCPVSQNLGERTEGVIAYMCPEGRLHIMAENCYVELLDPMTWTPVAPGKPGLLAVTDLVGETMPHLRVILDYTARWAGTPCPCGRTMPVLEGLEACRPQ